MIGESKITLRLVEILLILISLVFLFPIYYLIAKSFTSPALFNDPSALFPVDPYLGHYREAFDKVNIWGGSSNTALITFGSLALTIVLASMAGYIITRVNNRWYKMAFYFFLIGMVVPQIGSIFFLFKFSVDTHLVDTRIFLILLYTKNLLPVSIFLYAAFTKSVPRELEESAYVDGSGIFSTFWRIIFPLLLPCTGTIIITRIYSIWNDFLNPLIFLRSQDKMTLMVQIVQFYSNEQSTDYGPVFALSFLASIPLCIFFLLTQKYMLRGLVVGSVKG